MELGSLNSSEIFDASIGWDFSKEAVRAEALKCIADAQPKMIVAGVMCPRFSGGPGWRESRRHNLFVTELYRHQQNLGRKFLHVQPVSTNISSAHTIREGLAEVGCHWVQMRRLGKKGQVPAQNPERLVGISVATNCGLLARAAETENQSVSRAVIMTMAGEAPMAAR